MERAYWNEAIEAIQPAALRCLENGALRTQLDYVWSSSPFYQTKFAQAGIRRETIGDVADLPLLPFTEKDECRGSLFLTAVANTLAHFSRQLSGEFQLVVDHPLPHQYLRLRVELVQGLTAGQVPDLPQQIRLLLSQLLNFRAEPGLVPYGTLPRSEQKARRVIRTYEQPGR